jgi:hypothetical protein
MPFAVVADRPATYVALDTLNELGGERRPCDSGS